MKKSKRGVVGIALLSLLAQFFTCFSSTSLAAEYCSSSENNLTYDAIVATEKNDYNIYAKLGRLDQRSRIYLNRTSLESGECRQIGYAEANDVSWTLLGSLEVASDDELQVLQAYVDDKSAAQDASSPTLLFVPKNITTCANPNSCLIDFEGLSYSLEPKKVSVSSDTLKVAAYGIVNNPEVKNVFFYSDGNPLYSDASNLLIDEKRVEPGKHMITTRIALKDGQALVRHQEIARSFSLLNYLSTYFYRYKNILLTLVGVAGIYLLYAALFLVTAYLKRRRAWRIEHFNLVSRPTGGTSKRILAIDGLRQDFKLSVWLIALPLTVMSLYLAATSLVITKFSVDGVSMETTFTDKSTKWLFKLPVTLSAFNRSGYVPSRGEVVVFDKNESNLFIESEQKEAYVVKRVIGLPGDRVVLKDGIFTLFNAENPKGFNPDEGQAWSGVVLPSEGRFIDITLKEGELFVVGDNRVDSIDSRYYGPIKTEQIVGKVPYQSDRNSTPYAAD